MALAFAGSSGIVTAAILEVVRADPKALIAIVAAWGPQFVIVIICLVVMEHWFTRLLDTTEKTASASQANAEAQRSMAAAIEKIAARDSDADHERELLLNDIAFVLKEVRSEIGLVREQQLAHLAAIPQGRSSAAGGGD